MERAASSRSIADILQNISGTLDQQEVTILEQARSLRTEAFPPALLKNYLDLHHKIEQICWLNNRQIPTEIDRIYRTIQKKVLRLITYSDQNDVENDRPQTPAVRFDPQLAESQNHLFPERQIPLAFENIVDPSFLNYLEYSWGSRLVAVKELTAEHLAMLVKGLKNTSGQCFRLVGVAHCLDIVAERLNLPGSRKKAFIYLQQLHSGKTPAEALRVIEKIASFVPMTFEHITQPAVIGQLEKLLGTPVDQASLSHDNMNRSLKGLRTASGRLFHPVRFSALLKTVSRKLFDNDSHYKKSARYLGKLRDKVSPEKAHAELLAQPDLDFPVFQDYVNSAFLRRIEAHNQFSFADLRENLKGSLRRKLHFPADPSGRQLSSIRLCSLLDTVSKNLFDGKAYQYEASIRFLVLIRDNMSFAEAVTTVQKEYGDIVYNRMQEELSFDLLTAPRCIGYLFEQYPEIFNSGSTIQTALLQEKIQYIDPVTKLFYRTVSAATLFNIVSQEIFGKRDCFQGTLYYLNQLRAKIPSTQALAQTRDKYASHYENRSLKPLDYETITDLDTLQEVERQLPCSLKSISTLSNELKELPITNITRNLVQFRDGTFGNLLLVVSKALFAKKDQHVLALRFLQKLITAMPAEQARQEVVEEFQSKEAVKQQPALTEGEMGQEWFLAAIEKSLGVSFHAGSLLTKQLLNTSVTITNPNGLTYRPILLTSILTKISTKILGQKNQQKLALRYLIARKMHISDAEARTKSTATAGSFSDDRHSEAMQPVS